MSSRARTIADLLSVGDRDSLAITDTRGDGLTYAALRNLVSRTHDVLAKLGLTEPDTVAFSLANGPETAALFLALASYCRVAPLNPNYTLRELAFSLDDLKARVLITSGMNSTAIQAAAVSGVVPILLETPESSTPGSFILNTNSCTAATECARPEASPNQIALLLHTSGTTARPKLVPLTQDNLCLSSTSVADVLQLAPADRCLSLMPLFHIHGLVAGLLASIAAGATVCCAAGFQATRFFSWLESSQATWYTAVPTMHQAILLRAKHNAGILSRHKLRLIRSSSSPLYPAVWEQLESVFGVPVLNAYGMTEAAHQIASVRLPGGNRFRGTVGPTSGPEIAILDSRGALLSAGETGEVALRGRQIMDGYLQPDDANEKAFVNGWFRTGDEGHLDDHGILTLTGRIKEMINCGGEKISPYEVEEALLNHPAVTEAVVFAAPHALLGEEVAAAVVLREGCRLDEKELQDTLGARLARRKIPKRMVFLDELPRGATGKLQRIGLAVRLGMAPTGFRG